MTRTPALALSLLLLAALTAVAEDKKAAPAVASSGGVAVEIASWDQIQQAIARNQGKVVVVDYWSSWCVPCVKELPELVQLSKQFGQRIVCITVDVDFAGTAGEKPEDHRENVLGILQKNQVAMKNFIASEPDTVIFDKLRVASVPALHVIDQTGKIHKRFDNEDGAFGDHGFSILKDVRPVVVQLLK